MKFKIVCALGMLGIASTSYVEQSNPIVLESPLGVGNLSANGLSKSIMGFKAVLNPDRTATIFMTSDTARAFYGKWYRIRNSGYVLDIENGPEGATGTARLSVEASGKLESASLAASSATAFLKGEFRVPGAGDIAAVKAIQKWNRTVMGRGTVSLFGREPVPIKEMTVQVDENGSYLMKMRGGGRDWNFSGKWERVAGAVYRLKNEQGPLGPLRATGEVTLFQDHCGNMMIQSEPAVGEGASIQFTVTTDFDKADPVDPDNPAGTSTTFPDFKKPLPGKDIYSEEREGDGTVVIGAGTGKIQKAKVQIKDSGHMEITFIGRKNYSVRGTWKRNGQNYSGTAYYGLDSDKSSGTLTVTMANRKFSYIEWAGKSGTGEAVSMKFRPRDGRSDY